MNNNKHTFSDDELNRLYQYAITLCCSEHFAYDLLQSSLEKFLSQQASEQSIEHPIAYARKLIYHAFIDEYRRENKWPEEEYTCLLYTSPSPRDS